MFRHKSLEGVVSGLINWNSLPYYGELLREREQGGKKKIYLFIRKQKNNNSINSTNVLFGWLFKNC